MLVSEIITSAATLTDESYDNTKWIGFINHALDDLTPIVKTPKTKSSIAITLSGGNGAITIASDADLAKAHEFRYVYFTPTAGTKIPLKPVEQNDTISRGWMKTSTQILLRNCGSVSGTADVDYYEKLQHVSSVGDTPGLLSQYHNLIVFYACALSQQVEEELDDSNSFYVKYLAGKKQMELDRIAEINPRMRKAVEKARIAAALRG